MLLTAGEADADAEAADAMLMVQTRAQTGEREPRGGKSDGAIAECC